MTDTGSGLSPDIAERLFDPFVSTKDAGTGLGLSISRRIIEDHGGSIKVTAATGGGTAFEVRLPAVTDDVVESEDSGTKSCRNY